MFLELMKNPVTAILLIIYFCVCVSLICYFLNEYFRKNIPND